MHTAETLTTLTHTVLTRGLPEMVVSVTTHTHSQFRTSQYVSVQHSDGFSYRVIVTADNYGVLDVVGERPSYRYRAHRRTTILSVRKDGSYNFDLLIVAIRAKHADRVSQAARRAAEVVGQEAADAEMTALHTRLDAAQDVDAKTYTSFPIGKLRVSVSTDSSSGKLNVHVEGRYSLTGEQTAKLIEALRTVDIDSSTK
jgi:hypothetical protein